MTTTARQHPGVSASTSSASADAFRTEARRWARSQQQLVLLAADIDDSGIWMVEGHTSAASWIAVEAQVEACTGREWLRISRALRILPKTAAAYASGELSYAKVRTLTRVATPDNEAELLLIAFERPAAQLRTALAVWMRDNNDPEALDRLHRTQRSLTSRVEPDGVVRFSIVCPPEHGGRLQAALDTEVMRTRPRSGEAWPALDAQYYDAFQVVLERQAPSAVEVVVHVDADGGRFESGVPLTDTAVGRLLDGAFVRALIHDEDRSPIDASNKRRHPTTRQKRVVAARDQGCVDCGRSDLVNFDHVPPHTQTGHTLTAELEQRCAPCHHRRSE